MSIKKILEFYNLKLDLHTQDSGIKGMLKNMIKQDFSISDLKAKMNKKIEEEKEILLRLEQFEIESKNLPGEEVYRYEYESMSKNEIKEMIDRQKRELNDFISKFSDLDNFIKQYKEEVLEIKKVRASIDSSQKRL